MLGINFFKSNKVSAQTAILLRTKNRPLLLKRALKSITEQTDQDFCVVILNSGNKFEVENCIEEIKEKLKNKYLLIHINEGTTKGAALNIGIKYSDSKYIAIHDDDDSWKKEFLKKSIQAIDNKSALVTKTILVKEEINESEIVEKHQETFEDWQIHEISLFRLAESKTFPSIAFFFRRECISLVGEFNGNLNQLEDWEFSLRVFALLDTVFLEEELSYYHQRVSLDGSDYDNSHIKHIDLYRKTEIDIRNKFLSEDLKKEKFGLGQLMNLSSSYGSILKRVVKTEKNIPIVYCVDEKFIQPLCASLYSLLDKYESSNKLNIYIFVKNFSKNDKDHVLSLLPKEKSYEIFWREFPLDKVSFLDTSLHFSLANYFRLILADLIPISVNEILYLDADTIILSNITELFKYFDSNYHIQACIDYCGKIGNPLIKSNEALGKLKISPELPYYNSGVLFMNLKKWREDNSAAEVISFAKNNPDTLFFMDQTPINIIFRNKIGKLPSVWNAQTVHPKVLDGTFNVPYVAQSFKDAKIIHYTTEYKPWSLGKDLPHASFFHKTLEGMNIKI
ncbi:MAG: glycosyltransferase [Oligoflexia bacterium]|nr:glycosyltransferase [Oligoflexia bacterium]